MSQRLLPDVGGTPYDIKGAEFGHVGDQCSFDAIIRIYGIEDRCARSSGHRSCAAPTHPAPSLTPQCEGFARDLLPAVAHFRDDHEMLKHGVAIYDALYTWCRLQRQARQAELTMALKQIGMIEIPDSKGSSFDHGAFDARTRRVFVAHTGRSCVEVIDHDRGEAHRDAGRFSRGCGSCGGRRTSSCHQSRIGKPVVG